MDPNFSNLALCLSLLNEWQSFVFFMDELSNLQYLEELGLMNFFREISRY